MAEDVFAQRLNEAMAARGAKQVDVLHAAQNQGRKLGKSQLSQYVSGKTTPRADTMALLAELLGVDAAWLSGASNAGGAQGTVAAEATAGGASTSDAGANAAQAGEPSRTARARSHSNSKRAAATSCANSSSNTKTTTPSSASTPSPDSPKGTPMRTFSKSSKLDNVLYDVRGPVVDEANRMEESGTHVLKLNIGNPATFGFRTPDEVVYDMARQLPECEGYSASRGLFSARKAIMQYAQVKGLPNVTIDDVYTGNGVSELINLCMSALLDNGDEILIPSPDYPLWTACATLAGGTPVHYICDEQADWYPDLADMESKITDRTKALVIINPNNPTGALYPREVLEQIVEIARRHQLMIFSDEIYDRLVMSGEEHVSIASLAPDLFCVTFSGLSKSHMIAGYRIGWMVLSGNKRAAQDYILGLNMLSNMRLCSNVPAQSIVQTALGGHQSVKSYIVPGGRVYEQCEFVYNALNNIPGISVVKPKAAFYIFPKLDVKKFNITDDVQFALDLLREKKILIVQGTGFNWGQPDHFRIVYLPRIEQLSEAMTKLGDFLSTYQQH